MGDEVQSLSRTGILLAMIVATCIVVGAGFHGIAMRLLGSPEIDHDAYFEDVRIIGRSAIVETKEIKYQYIIDGDGVAETEIESHYWLNPKTIQFLGNYHYYIPLGFDADPYEPNGSQAIAAVLELCNTHFGQEIRLFDIVSKEGMIRGITISVFPTIPLEEVESALSQLPPSGSRGRSTGPYLHYGLRANDQPTNSYDQRLRDADDEFLRALTADLETGRNSER